MKKVPALFCAGMVLFASLAGCSGAVDAVDPSSPTADQAGTEVPGSPAVSEAGQKFLLTIFETGLLEMNAAKLAARKSQNIQVQRFAEMMYQSYARVNDNVSQFALANDFELPVELSQNARATLEQFDALSGDEFDRAYSQEMRRAHRRVVQGFSEAAQNAPDAIIRAFAQSQLPAMRDRLRVARSLSNSNLG